MAFSGQSVADVHDGAPDWYLLAAGSDIDRFGDMVYFSPIETLPCDAESGSGATGRAADRGIERIGIRESGSTFMGAGAHCCERE